ncbi:Ig-like domain-containing protein [Colwellia sp. UCD-KL20]|uniref:beta strand repeat-containing protein n=1 Tax=Colwellia sp. UCD-KL20 TaxID=1917165 RepID=UPI000970394E|nr:Ig-like domain-containing protein [Colwellia sp. UCD-KL20]
MALLQRFSLIILLFTLVACGGGEGGFGTATPDPEEPEDKDVITMSLAISDQNISDASPATINATVLKNDEPLENVFVTFSLNEGADVLAHFTPTLGTSVTGTDGVASMILNAGGTAGAGQVSATISILDEEIIRTLSFNSAGDANTGTTPDVSNISLFASSQQIASSGAQEITLSAIAKNEANNLLEDVSITFAASSGEIEIIDGVTGPDGKATAILKTSSDPSNRTITVTATTAQFSDSVDVQVIGTSVQLTGSSSLAINDSNDFIVRVIHSDGESIKNTLVTLSTSNSGSASITLPESVNTGPTGQATISVTGTTGGSNSITASALGASATQNVAVQADSFLFSSFNDGNGTNINLTSQNLDSIPDVLLSKTATITLTWLRSSVIVPDGTLVNFTATRGNLSATSARTVDGKVSTSLTSNNAGKSLVTFSGVDGDIALNNQLEFEFVAETASTIVAQASPHSIGPNGQTSIVSVVVKDTDGNLVKNKVIKFNLDDVTGGEISPATAVTDSNGSASTLYTSNTVSAQDAVSINAVVTDTPTVNDTVTLTVADRELFITLGTGNTIEEIDITNYNKQFSVFVTDVDSTPVENVELTVSAVANAYYKGHWARAYDAAGTFLSWVAVGEVTSGNSLPTTYTSKHKCISEDSNINGILDLGEDINGDGKLTPTNVVSAEGNIITDDQGKAIIDILYPQSNGSWADIDLIVSAKVNGTESQTKTIFTLSTSAEDILDEDVTPPTSSIGLNSPFGRALDCNISD